MHVACMCRSNMAPNSPESRLVDVDEKKLASYLLKFALTCWLFHTLATPGMQCDRSYWSCSRRTTAKTPGRCLLKTSAACRFFL